MMMFEVLLYCIVKHCVFSAWLYRIAFGLQADKDSMRAVRSHSSYQLTFTLLNPQPDILNVTWDIEGGIDSK